MKYTLGLLILISLFSACKKEDLEKIKKENEEEIINYLKDKGLTAEKTGSGLYYIIEEPGTGDRPNINSKVTVHYHGYYSDEEVFDSSIDRGEASEFSLSGVIEGWQEGIPLFKKGGKGVLLIPSHLGYGSSPPAGIRNNAVLIFDIELINVR